MNSYPSSPSPLGLNARKGNWDRRSRVGTRSLNTVKHRFVMVSGSSLWLSGTSCSSTYLRLSSDITFTKVKLSFSLEMDSRGLEGEEWASVYAGGEGEDG